METKTYAGINETPLEVEVLNVAPDNTEIRESEVSLITDGPPEPEAADEDVATPSELKDVVVGEGPPAETISYMGDLMTVEEYESEMFADSSFIRKVPEDGFYYHDFIPMEEEWQHALWNECRENGIEYAFAIATIQHESTFNPDAAHHNDNGSTDRGICQVNSCWIKKLKGLGYIESADDLYDPITGIKCGMWVLKDAVDAYGNTERAYAFYNTGNQSVKSNSSSRIVWEYRNKWLEKLREAE